MTTAIKPSISSLQQERTRWPDNWHADIDAPGTPAEEWTGKWYAMTPDGENAEVECDVSNYNARLARYLEQLHNAVPVLLEIAAAALAANSTPCDCHGESGCDETCSALQACRAFDAAIAKVRP